MRASMIAGVLALLVLAVGTANASPDPYRDQAERIPCPAAPSGWTHPSESEGGRYILTPLTTVEQTDDPSVLAGAPVVQLDCNYKSTGNRELQVSVRYALPIDINPWNDFYIGCTSTGRPQPATTAAHAWNDRERVFRVVGAKTWSLATFIDDLKALGKDDVPRFEAMTRAMLSAAQPYAHNCKLAGGGEPVNVKSLWSFGFNARTTHAGVTSSASTNGSFVTTGVAGSATGAIGNLFASDFHLKVTSRGKTQWMAIHVGAPIEFRHAYGTLLRTHIVVTGSTDAGCRKGATGTLLVSLQNLTPPQVAVKLCGHTYLDGKGTVQAKIQTV